MAPSVHWSSTVRATGHASRSAAIAATSTGLGCGVPGFWGGYEASRERFGTRPSKELCAAAIAYARDGFEVHPFLFGEMFTMANELGRSEQAREIFFAGGALLSREHHAAAPRRRSCSQPIRVRNLP